MPSIPEDEDARLAELRSYEILDTQPEPAFDDLVRIAAAACETPAAGLTLVDAEREWYKARVGIDDAMHPRDAAFGSHVTAAGELLAVEDAGADERFAEHPLVAGPLEIRFYAGAPLVSEHGRVLGTICVLDREPRRLSPHQEVALDALSRLAVQALEYRRRKGALQEEFVALAAHELRTPLAAIRGYVEELLEQAETMTETQRQFLEVIERNSALLESRLDNLLLLADAWAKSAISSRPPRLR